METHFLLADNVYCKASVPPTDKVCLWLGVSRAHIKVSFISCFLSSQKHETSEAKSALNSSIFVIHMKLSAVVGAKVIT